MTKQLYTPEFEHTAVALLLKSGKSGSYGFNNLISRKIHSITGKNCIKISLILPFLIHLNFLNKNWKSVVFSAASTHCRFFPSNR